MLAVFLHSFLGFCVVLGCTVAMFTGTCCCGLCGSLVLVI